VRRGTSDVTLTPQLTASTVAIGAWIPEFDRASKIEVVSSRLEPGRAEHDRAPCFQCR